MLNNKVYDIMKYVTTIAIPAFATLYFALAGVWGWSFAEEVLATCTAIETCLGILLGISTAEYNKKVNSDGKK